MAKENYTQDQNPPQVSELQAALAAVMHVSELPEREKLVEAVRFAAIQASELDSDSISMRLGPYKVSLTIEETE